MNTLSLLLAWRYFYTRQHERSISWMVIICFMSIFLGAFALALVIAVMNGFEKETCKKMQGIHAPISIDAHGESLDWHAIKEVLAKEFPVVCATAPTTVKQVIIQLPGSDDINNVVLLSAIDPLLQKNVTTLEQTVEQSLTKPTLDTIIHRNHILIGSFLAEALEASCGNTVTILFMPEDGSIQSKQIRFEQKNAIIGGTFKTGIEEFDNHIVYCSFDLLQELFPDSDITRIDLKLSENCNEKLIIEQLKKRLHLNVYSWQDLYPALVSALKLEKYAMFLILILIILVASMNIMSLLFTQIVQKRGDIAILKALGMANSTIRAIFLVMGMFIAFIATTIGLVLALFACLFLKNYPCIKLPDAYYASHLPVSIEPYSFIIIFLSIMIICFVATWFATHKTTRITISSVLRFDA